MENQNTSQNQDIDLNAVKQQLKSYFTKVNDSFFDIILFIKRYSIAIIILFIIGVGLGIFLDMSSKVYSQKIFVTPNFGSVDYLYEEVGLMNAKLKEHDTLYLKKMGINKVKSIAKIEIEPIVDIYDFINDRVPGKDNNKIDLFKIISENGEVEKIIEEKTISRYYKYHVITITTKEKFNDKSLVAPILDALNSNPYWLQVQKETLNNLRVKMQANTVMLEQVDKILADYGNIQAGTSGVTLRTDNTNIADIFNFKNSFIADQALNRLNEIDYQKIIKDRGIVLNIRETNVTSGKMKIILPLLLLILFTAGIKFRDYYRSQMAKRSLK
ncbi:hypothetical protein ACLI09_00700 [Flavobacterium sp. RHBU_24]|uniref:hypothetical protein n=1 Tax=Flavobacterium sp. RHBU_24 TaxID=3391185 RepID=UPI003984EDFD